MSLYLLEKKKKLLEVSITTQKQSSSNNLERQANLTKIYFVYTTWDQNMKTLLHNTQSSNRLNIKDFQKNYPL